jgi:hypothetical protein
VVLLLLAACEAPAAEWQPPAGSFIADSAMLAGESLAEPVMVSLARVTPAFIDSVPVPPILGRNFVRDDFGGTRTALLSEPLWRDRLGARPDLIGRTIELGGQPVVIVGIMPASFDQPSGTQIWVAGS